MDQTQRNLIMNFIVEPGNEIFNRVFSSIAHCCKINGFNKTSKSLSLCSPVETLTLLGAVITASVSTLWQREELGFPERNQMKNLFLIKMKAGFLYVCVRVWVSLGLLCCISRK